MIGQMMIQTPNYHQRRPIFILMLIEIMIEYLKVQSEKYR